MKICLKCKTKFIPSKGLINYCSLQCRNSHIVTEEHKRKTSASLRGRIGRKRTLEEIKKYSEKATITCNKKILDADFDSLKSDRLRKRIILEQKGKCNTCKLDLWIEKPIILELEHKDGNHQNNSRENLEALCPNCHSFTKTWRGRNKKSSGNKKRVSDEDLGTAIFNNNYNFRQALLSVGLAPKGGNYCRCHKLTRIMTSKL